jgi:predicted RNA-binding Zn ribbon-like protein
MINRLARAVVAGEEPRATDVNELNRWARRPPLAPQLNGGLERGWAADCLVQGALALVAREAVELLTSPERELIRECAAAPTCSLLYLDRSHARRRRWCEMDRCGSRAKMTSYRQRRATSATD